MTHDLWLQYEIGAWCINVALLITNWLLFDAMQSCNLTGDGAVADGEFHHGNSNR